MLYPPTIICRMSHADSSGKIAQLRLKNMSQELLAALLLGIGKHLFW